ncbi:hypothetical protein N8I77_001083 [Diaporthe amygdali]|uniref:Uncharacterized protein n=1 Tax=Phomopsis amygdali TaxID=1214568 RepID=A0AAD9W7S4_PHOAM|nr:hypothetical protein N8I77_001083 [Diaporthe amygdali]
MVEGSGQKAVTVPHAFSVQQQPLQSAPPEEAVDNFILPLRQPLQPGSVRSFSSGHHHSSSEKVVSDKYYWPMNSIHGSHGSPYPGLSLPENPDAIHIGHSVGDFSKPMLVSDKNFIAPFTATNDPASADECDAPSKVALGFSPEYHGDPNLMRNRSANIPDELNCSLFLVNLPPTLTTHRLIAAIHAMGPTGRIYATHINAPEPDRKHYGCAAKVIFFELAAAKAFYRACEDNGFTVDGYNVRVMWNRIKTAQQEHAKSTTRVLLIGGKPQFVNPTTLTEYFCTKLQFQIDCIVTHSDGLKGGTDAVVEYRFGSFRCQAEAAKMALTREHPEVRCFFHCDPCDPGHWKPSQRIPVAPIRPQNPLPPPIRPFRYPGIWPYQPLTIVQEDEEDQRVGSTSHPMHPTVRQW